VVADPNPGTIYGPRPVQGNGNVSVPRELWRALGIELGNAEVHFALNPDKPGTLVVIPDSLMADIFEKGWTAV